MAIRTNDPVFFVDPDLGVEMELVSALDPRLRAQRPWGDGEMIREVETGQVVVAGKAFTVHLEHREHEGYVFMLTIAPDGCLRRAAVSELLFAVNWEWMIDEFMMAPQWVMHDCDAPPFTKRVGTTILKTAPWGRLLRWALQNTSADAWFVGESIEDIRPLATILPDDPPDRSVTRQSSRLTADELAVFAGEWLGWLTAGVRNAREMIAAQYYIGHDAAGYRLREARKRGWIERRGNQGVASDVLTETGKAAIEVAYNNGITPPRQREDVTSPAPRY